ncbi:MAG: polyprenyl synthetase family protein [Pseudomonadota bacterium]
MKHFDLDQYLADLRRVVNAKLLELLPPQGESDPLNLRKAMSQAVLGGGKRLRPCVTIAACQAVGGTIKQALAPACALEMVHCYSLVHDDLPSMDNDDMRRGQPTCHKQFGEPTALLVGDGLLTLAFETIAEDAVDRTNKKNMLHICLELARAAGPRGMVGGQAMDISLKDAQPSFELLELCNSGKTAALFSAAATMGALAGNGPQESVDLLRSYGFDLGLAFQHADDIQDAEFPAHRELALTRAKELSQRAIRTAEKLGSNAAPLVSLAELIQIRAQTRIKHEISESN